MAKKIIAWFLEIYRNSFLCGIFNKISLWYSKNINSSLIVNFFNGYDRADDDYFKFTRSISSVWKKLFGWLSFVKISSQNSFIVKKVRKLFYNIHKIPIKYFGIAFISFGIVGTIGELIKQNFGLALYLHAGLIILGLIFSFIKCNLSHFLSTSFFALIFGFNFKEEASVEIKGIGFALVGVLAGFLSCVAGVKSVLLCFALAICFSVAVYSVFFAVLIFAIVLPFMPTMVMVALSLAIIACLIIKKFTGFYDFKAKGSILNVYVCLMCLVYVLGTVNSFSLISSLKASLVYITFILSFFFITKTMDTTGKLKTLISSIVIASIPVSLYGIYQKLTGFDQENTWIDSEMFEDISGRVVSFFENPNVFGEYLIIAFILCFLMIFITKGIKGKGFYAIVLALLGVSMIFTYSRGCWIGLIASVAVFLFFADKRLFFCGVLIGLVSLFFLPESIIGRISSVGNLSDSSTSYRVYIWNGTLEMLKDFWATGIGVGTDAFNMVYPRYAYSAISAPHPHNLYLLILSETGIIGFLVFLAVIISLFNKLLYVVKNTENITLKYIAISVGSGMTGFLIQGMFDNVWYNYRVFLFFWIFVAIGACTYNIFRREQNR